MLLFAAAFAFTFAVFKPDRAPRPGPEPDAPVALLETAEAVLHYLREDGRIASTEVVSLPGDLVGLTLPELAAARPDWRVVSFAPERVVASVPCGPVTGASGFVGPRDGKVAVFRGSPEGCHELVEITNLNADLLGEGPERPAYIPFEDPAELPFILDGLRGRAL